MRISAQRWISVTIMCIARVSKICELYNALNKYALLKIVTLTDVGGKSESIVTLMDVGGKSYCQYAAEQSIAVVQERNYINSSRYYTIFIQLCTVM